jgi:predicted AlkP superfamily phosphohydrolase/phosphomutase
MTETIVLGLDGANWDLLGPWLEEGRLPNISQLSETGVTADLKSCLPPVTCPNWRCYSTGKNPGKLGVYWWEKIDTETRSLSTPDSRSFKSANYWDYLNDEGYTAGIMNLPMTYPPFEIEEYMIAGGPGSEQHEYTRPRELGEQLDREGYQLHPDVPVTSKDNRGPAEGLIKLIEQRLHTFRELLRTQDVDVAHCTVFYINVLQHYFWRDELTRRAWEVIDTQIGKLREEHPEATLLLISDHGCKDVDTVFYINQWLEEEGYLQTTTSAAEELSGVGLNKERLSQLAHRFGVHETLTSLAPEWVTSRIPESDDGFKREQKLGRVNWAESTAIASGQGLVYLIGSDDRVQDALIEDLLALTNNGQPIARNVLTAEEAYHGEYTSEAPDIVFDQRPGVHTSGAIGSNSVFLAAGPQVTAESMPSELSIVDIAPTVLTSVGCGVPRDIDGESLPLFADKTTTTRDPLPFDASDQAMDEELQNRLEDLGYLE